MSGHSPEDFTNRGFRFPAGIPAELNGDGRPVPCEAQNLSRTGVLLVGPMAAPSRQTADVTLKSRTGTYSVRVSGRVIRTEPGDAPGELQIAVAFQDLTEDQKAGIEVLVARVIETQAPGSLDSLRPGSPSHDVKKTLETIPLAQRINLASRAGLKEREFLRQDQNPAVLESLVRNPSFTIAEARALAASPFLMTGTIDALAGDVRYGRDEELSIALATHAHVSPFTAERLTADFKTPQIRKVLARPGLSGSLREKLFKRMVRG